MACKKSLILELVSGALEGQRNMPAISKSTFTLFILAILLFTPIPVWNNVAVSDNTTFSGLGASLSQTLATSQPEDIIPIVVHFPEGNTPSEMIDAIRLSGLSSVVIRHAFHIIPMVSLYIRSDEVNLLAENMPCAANP